MLDLIVSDDSLVSISTITSIKKIPLPRACLQFAGEKTHPEMTERGMVSHLTGVKVVLGHHLNLT